MEFDLDAVAATVINVEEITKKSIIKSKKSKIQIAIDNELYWLKRAEEKELEELFGNKAIRLCTIERLKRELEGL